MKRRDDVGRTGFQAHLFEGLFLTVHVFQAFIGVNNGKQVVNGICGHLRVGNPQGTVLEGTGIIVHTAVGAGGYRQFAEIGILVIKTRSDGVRIQNADGNWSYDVSGSYGVNLLGHDFYKACIRKAVDKTDALGPVLGPYHPVVSDNVDLIRSIRTGEPLNETEAVAFSTLTGIMGRESAYSGKVVTWDQALNSKQDFTLGTYEFGPKLPLAPVPMPGTYEFV